jgi:hypothetical protein
MKDDRGDRLPRASTWEIVGAWLHIWTPRRGTYVPPVPVFRLLAAAALIVAAAAALTVKLGDWKDEARERERRAEIASAVRFRARLAREQAPRRVRVPGAATAGANDDEVPRRRRRLLDALERAITDDARARHERGSLSSRVDHTECKPYVRPAVERPPEPPLRAARWRYECLGITSRIQSSSVSAAGSLGYPFWVWVDFRRGRAAWCKVNPRSAERGIGGDRYVALHPDCDLDRD